MNQKDHALDITRNTTFGFFEGSCSCSDADWVDDGWSGQVTFSGDTEGEIQDYFHDHLVEEGVL